MLPEFAAAGAAAFSIHTITVIIVSFFNRRFCDEFML